MDTATAESSPLSLHDALPILTQHVIGWCIRAIWSSTGCPHAMGPSVFRLSRGWYRPHTGCSVRQAQMLTFARSEEHTSELQSRVDVVCRLLLEEKKKDDALVS